MYVILEYACLQKVSQVYTNTTDNANLFMGESISSEAGFQAFLKLTHTYNPLFFTVSLH